MVKIYQIFGKVIFNLNDPLPVLLGNEWDHKSWKFSQHLLVFPGVKSEWHSLF